MESGGWLWQQKNTYPASAEVMGRCRHPCWTFANVTIPDYHEREAQGRPVDVTKRHLPQNISPYLCLDTSKYGGNAYRIEHLPIHVTSLHNDIKMRLKGGDDYFGLYNTGNN